MTRNKYTTILDTIYNINNTYHPLQIYSHWKYLQYLYIPQ